MIRMFPNLLSSIILSENITTADISKVYIDDSFLTNNESIQKKTSRFLNNSKFDGISFYNASNRHNEIDELTKKWLFSEKVIFKAINEVIEFLSPLNTKITFLGDRWFCNLKIKNLMVLI